MRSCGRFAPAVHQRRSLEAARIIAADPGRYGGLDAALVRWAEGTLRNADTPSPEQKAPARDRITRNAPLLDREGQASQVAGNATERAHAHSGGILEATAQFGFEDL